jgi:hypothetical protein
MNLILLLLLPFVQIGFSYYASAATVMATLLFISIAPSLKFTPPTTWLLVGGVSAFLFFSAVAVPGSTGVDLLRRGRETFFFALLVVAVTGVSRHSSLKVGPRTHVGIISIIVFLAAMTAAQFLILKSRAYFGLPREWYIQNGETLPSLLDLRYSHIRPFASFGEPSYLAFVLLSLLIMITPLIRDALTNMDPARSALRRRQAVGGAHSAALIGAVLIATAGAMSQSLSFYLAVPILLYLGSVRHASGRVRFWLAVIAGIVLFLILGNFVATVVLGRLSNGMADSSVSARFMVPLQILPQYLAENPLGAPPTRLVIEVSELASRYGAPGYTVLQNAVLNLAFNYGIAAIPCVLLVIIAPKNMFISIYILACTMLNGAIFAVDKFAVITLAVAIYSSYEAYLKNMYARAPAKSAARFIEPAPILTP